MELQISRPTYICVTRIISSFDTQTQTSQIAQRRLSIPVLGRTRTIHSHFAHSYLNFEGSQKYKILPRFSTEVAFDERWFLKGARYRKSSWNADDIRLGHVANRSKFLKQG